MPKPRLYVFAVSHYCEKARWALDYLQIDYDLYYLGPGHHRKMAKTLGLRRSGLPFMVADGEVVQGSANIIDWAGTASTDGDRRLLPPSAREDCLAIEKRFDDVIGIHARRYCYSAALTEQPRSLRPIFTAHLPRLQKLIVTANWEPITRLMIRGMDLGPRQGDESKQVVDEELRWLDALLSDGRQFLAGDEFSRADIAGASLLAPLVLPREHPTYDLLKLPPKLADDVARWRDRPSFAWTRDLYARYR